MQSDGVFGPEEIRVMQAAFERSWRAVADAFGDCADCAEALRLREILAQQIIALAKDPEKDPASLAGLLSTWIRQIEARRDQPLREGFEARASSGPLQA